MVKLKKPAGIKSEKTIDVWIKNNAEPPSAAKCQKTRGAAQAATYKEFMEKDLPNLSVFPEVKMKKENNPAVKATIPDEITWKKTIILYR